MSDERPTGELRYRQSTVSDVSFPERVVDLIVIPYEEETLVEVKGRMVTESILRGAFDGIERRANRVRVNRDHRLERTVGRALSFDPTPEEGLIARLKIAKTELGDETLELAADDCLDASAGYLPMAGGEKWLSRSRVQMTKCWLGHVALTPDPAYSGARVLAVRQTANGDLVQGSVEPTPNLDLVRGWQLAEQYERMTG